MQRAVEAGTWSGTGPESWARAALARLAALPAVTRVGIALTEGGGRRLQFVASDRDNEPALQWCHVDAYADVPLNTAVRSGALVAGSLEDLAPRYAEFVAHQDRGLTASVAAVPIIAAGQTLGGFVLFYGATQPFDGRQQSALSALGADLGLNLRRLQRSRTRRRPAQAEEPSPDGVLVTTYDVPADPAAVRAVRGFLLQTLAAWKVPDDAADTAALCLSELVTNALIHTHDGCEVRAVLDDRVLTISVRDGGSTVVRSEQLADPLQVHGRGLQVVEALAERWGSDLDEVGTTVWFVLQV